MKYLFPLIAAMLALNACSSTQDVAKTEKTISASEGLFPTLSKSASETTLWQTYRGELPDEKKRIELSSSTIYKCDFEVLLKMLEGSTTNIVLPTTEGFMVFTLTNSSTMNEKLAAKYPGIKSYKGTSLDGKYRARVDTNDEGLFAEVTGLSGYKSLLSPYFKNNKVFYAVYLENAVTKIPRNKSFD